MPHSLSALIHLWEAAHGVVGKAEKLRGQDAYQVYGLAIERLRDALRETERGSVKK